MDGVKPKGGYSCCVRGCRNHLGIPNIKLYRIPKEQDRGREWLRRAGMDDNVLRQDPLRWHNSYRICSKHFPACKVLHSGRLTWNAMPSLFLDTINEETFDDSGCSLIVDGLVTSTPNRDTINEETFDDSGCSLIVDGLVTSTPNRDTINEETFDDSGCSLIVDGLVTSTPNRDTINEETFDDSGCSLIVDGLVTSTPNRDTINEETFDDSGCSLIVDGLVTSTPNRDTINEETFDDSGCSLIVDGLVTSTPKRGSINEKVTGCDTTSITDVVVTEHDITTTPKKGNCISSRYKKDELTPRRVALRSALRGTRVTICKLRKKYEKLRSNRASLDVMGKLKKALSPAAYSLVTSNVNICNRSKFGRRWTAMDKVTALSLAFHCRKSYSALRQIFILPAVSSLGRWLSDFKLSAGLSYSIMKGLQLIAGKLDVKDKICVLNIDEISIKKNLYYDRSSDRIIGLVDSGNGSVGDTNATCALVLMARGLTKHWKQPIGFILGSGACDVFAVRGLLTEGVKEMRKAGYSVVASVCDQGSNFIQLQRELGVTCEKPYYYVEGQKVFFFYDYCHLLKATRNNLLNNTYEFGGSKASWRDIIMVYERDVKRKFRQAPKLTAACVCPNNFQKMKVAYCCRVFSNTVAAMLEVASEANSSVFGTAEFVGRMDQLFDCFNSTVMRTTKALRRPMADGTNHLNVLKDSLALFESLKVYNQDHREVTGRMKFIKGWKVTINATISLWHYLLNNCNVDKLCLRRLNQDCLENFFGQIRQRGGCCKNPTAYQFQQAYKNLCYRSLIMSSPSGNCKLDPDQCMLVFKDITGLGQQTSSVSSSNISFAEPDEADRVAEIMQWDMGERQAFLYVAGVVLHKLLLWHPCPHCEKLEVSHEGLTNEDQMFIHLKAFDKSSPFGSLRVPSTVFLDYLLACETIFASVTRQSVGGVGILSTSLEMALATLSSPMCEAAPLQKLLSYFFRIRIYFTLKFRNMAQ